MTTSSERSKACRECGATFVTRSNGAKYCPECGPEIKRRKDAERQSRSRARRRAERAGLPAGAEIPPPGPVERQELARAQRIERTAEQVMRVRPRRKGYVSDEDELSEDAFLAMFFGFLGQGYRRFVIVGSHAKGDLDRLGSHDEVSRMFNNIEKLIADPHERRESTVRLRLGIKALLEEEALTDKERATLRSISRNATRRGRAPKTVRSGGEIDETRR